MKTNLFIAALVAVCCSACNNSNTTSDNTTKSDSTTVGTVRVDSAGNGANATMDHSKMSMTAADFLTMAADVGMFEIEAAKMALKNSKDAQVKEFANKMITDHTAMAKDVKDLAGKKNVTLPEKLSADHQEKADKLKGLMGKDFDKEYASTMVKGHQDCIDHFEDASKNNADADVKTLATNSLPTLKGHKDMADKLDKHVGEAK